ncbi:hypothetical protein GCM10027072_10710 [Streptomyces bullii]
MTTVQDTPLFDGLAEVPTVPVWCQRWNGPRHSFRDVGEGGFDARRYAAELLPEKESKTFVVEHYYCGSFRRAVPLRSVRHRRRRGATARVAMFGVPVTVAVPTRPLNPRASRQGARKSVRSDTGCFDTAGDESEVPCRRSSRAC